jgi:hypothetical protein
MDSEAPQLVVESCWIPTVYSCLEKQGQAGQPNLKSDCPICSKTMDISFRTKEVIAAELASESPVSIKEAFYVKYGLEPTMALQCGHLVCWTCFGTLAGTVEEQLEAADQATILQVKCPECDEKIGCNRCAAEKNPVLPVVPWPLDLDAFNPLQVLRDTVPSASPDSDPEPVVPCSACLRNPLPESFVPWKNVRERDEMTGAAWQWMSQGNYDNQEQVLQETTQMMTEATPEERNRMVGDSRQWIIEATPEERQQLMGATMQFLDQLSPEQRDEIMFQFRRMMM